MPVTHLPDYLVQKTVYQHYTGDELLPQLVLCFYRFSLRYVNVLSKSNHREHGENIRYQYVMGDFIPSPLCSLNDESFYSISKPLYIKIDQ